jgi:hypothetical protein
MPQATKTKKRTAKSRSNGGKAVKSRAKTSASRSSANSSRSQSSARTNNGSLIDKAKTPAIAAGAMLVGVAGGVTAMRNGRKRKVRIPRPKLKLSSAPSLPKSHGSTAKWVGEKAHSLGDAGHRVADLTDQVAKVEKSLRK